MGLGDIVGKALGGKSSGSNLEDFLSHFSSSEGKWINQIDPLNTFDVSIKFYPTIAPKKEKKQSTLSKIGSSLLGAAKSAVKEGLNSATGGLVGSLMNSKVDIKKLHDKYDGIGQYTFMEYLASANLLVGQEDWIGENAGQTVRPLELQLGMYCQEITIPNLKIPDDQTAQTFIGEMPLNGSVVIPDKKDLTMTIVNTRVPLLERIFYPWMREVTLPWWSYETQPYTTATITVDFTKHSDIKYVFYGCRPTQINTQQAKQTPDGDNITRQLIMLFDFMIVKSNLKVTESAKDKLLGSGKTLLNSASKMLNF